MYAGPLVEGEDQKEIPESAKGSRSTQIELERRQPRIEHRP